MFLADRPRANRRPRAGFTLVEVMIVIAILIALTALTIGAAFQVLATQRRSNSEQTVQSVFRALDRQWKAAIDMSQVSRGGSAPPTGVNMMAADSRGPNKARAQVIWTKLQMKREFPQTFVEAVNPMFPITSVSPGSLTLPASIGGGTYSLTVNEVQPMPTYVHALSTIGPTHNVTTEPGAMLYLALKQSRRGENFDPDSLGSSAIQDTDGDGLKEIVDAWGVPLGFWRFPTGFPEFATVNPSARIRDPQDPEGLLLDPAWNNQASYNAQQGVFWFEQLLHLAHDPTIAVWTPKSFYLTPVVGSAGKDNVLATNPGYVHGLDYYMNPDPGPPPAFSTAYYDNLYGFRRYGERGD
jgi:type II secretory pathway pseudopilin PulG